MRAENTPNEHKNLEMQPEIFKALTNEMRQMSSLEAGSVQERTSRIINDRHANGGMLMKSMKGSKKSMQREVTQMTELSPTDLRTSAYMNRFMLKPQK